MKKSNYADTKEYWVVIGMNSDGPSGMNSDLIGIYTESHVAEEVVKVMEKEYPYSGFYLYQGFMDILPLEVNILKAKLNIIEKTKKTVISVT